MKQQLETAAVALGVGVLAYVGYSIFRQGKTTATSPLPAVTSGVNYGYTPDTAPIYTYGGNRTEIMDARDYRAQGAAPTVGSVG